MYVKTLNTIYILYIRARETTKHKVWLCMPIGQFVVYL